MAEAIISALNAGKIGSTYNVGSGKGTTNIEVIEMIQEILKPTQYRCRYTTLPSRAFDVPANILSSDLLKQHTSWSPSTTLEVGLQATWDAMSKELL